MYTKVIKNSKMPIYAHAHVADPGGGGGGGGTEGSSK